MMTRAPRGLGGVTWAVALTALAALAALAALVGCAGSPPTRYHTLEGIAPSAASADGSRRAAYDGPPIEVRSVQVPPAMDRLELTRDTGPGEIQIREFDHWAAPLGRLARQALTEDLALRLPPDRVVFPGAVVTPAGPALSASTPALGSTPTPSSASAPAAANLTLNVLSYRVEGGTATMLMSWSLRSPSANLGESLRLQAPSTGDAEATARAWADLLAQASDKIVLGLTRSR